jgi:glycosyltransferase involved in cell wall biosynthesis
VVEDAVNSIINQSYKDWHLVIVNDASTDNTFKILSQFKSHPQITILTNKSNRGVFYSINRALWEFKNYDWRYFTVHGADDTSSYDRFSVYINTFKTHPKLSAIVGVSNGKRWDMTSDPPQIKYHSYEHATGINFYKKDIFNTLGYFYNTRFAGDAEYTERFISYLANVCPPHIDEVVFKDEVIQTLPPQYGYTYTTGFHKNSTSLTKKYNNLDRKNFKETYQQEHATFPSVNHFFKFFVPHFEDRNLPYKGIDSKILVATPMWGRYELTKKFIKHHQNLGLDVLVVGSEGEKSRKLCEDLNCAYLETPNSPIGAKFNKRVDYFLENEQYTHLLLLGSDDFIDEKTLDIIKYHIQYLDVVSWKDIYFYNPETSTTIYSPGYLPGHYRQGEPLAPGRCLSRNVIKNYFGGVLWESDVQSSPDGGLWNKLKKLDNQIILSCRDYDNIIVDVKTKENITPFSVVESLSKNTTTEQNIKNKISQWFKNE